MNCRAVAVTGVDEVLRFWWIGGQPLCSAALLFTNDFELGGRIQIAGAADGSLGRDQLAERPEAHTGPSAVNALDFPEDALVLPGMFRA